MQRKPGQVSFGDSEALDNMLLLASLARLPPDIPDETRRNLVRQAISRVPADQAPSPAAVLAELENAASEYLSLPRQPFVLVTTASLKLPRPSVIIPVEGSRIVLSKRLHSRFKMPETVERRMRRRATTAPSACMYLRAAGCPGTTSG